MYESDEQNSESVSFIIACRKARIDGKVSGSIPAAIIAGEPLNKVKFEQGL